MHCYRSAEACLQPARSGGGGRRQVRTSKGIEEVGPSKQTILRLKLQHSTPLLRLRNLAECARARDAVQTKLGAATAKESTSGADSEIVKDIDMVTSPEPNISDYDDAAAARWLRLKLAPARQSVAKSPTAEAIDRIRARVFGDAVPRRRHRSIAA